ncbi:class I SAM-dependent methyltransferase [Acinetobacter beijerinckii]|uniref:class I SAM-dependent methyltransferase n=1 Tax=Acinetobacter beijerinckii TaxID=262668 RepID=UPI0030D8BD80
MTEHIRQAHVATNIASRALKAQKIEQLLQFKLNSQTLKILEIGCGSGGISYYFAHHKKLKCEVYAVDVYDNRQETEGYRFTLVESTALPFADEYFDIVITNHVIEHVGEEKEQLHHLFEIKRVLKQTGQCYLAVPNRWMLIEPHYQLKFLSWLPHSLRTPYLKFMGKGNFYDCEPLELKQLENMLTHVDFHFHNLSVEATKATFNIEKSNSSITWLINKIPNAILAIFRFIIPTLIYRLKK